MGRDNAKAPGGGSLQPARAAGPPAIGGHDDNGGLFGSLEELWAKQSANREEWYQANKEWWDNGGYGGANDDEAMIGDEGSQDDLEHSSRYLQAALERSPRAKRACAMDGGAGVGRVTGCTSSRAPTN
jgi:hypothetical protein